MIGQGQPLAALAVSNCRLRETKGKDSQDVYKNQQGRDFVEWTTNTETFAVPCLGRLVIYERQAAGFPGGCLSIVALVATIA